MYLRRGRARVKGHVSTSSSCPNTRRANAQRKYTRTRATEISPECSLTRVRFPAFRVSSTGVLEDSSVEKNASLKFSERHSIDGEIVFHRASLERESPVLTSPPLCPTRMNFWKTFRNIRRQMVVPGKNRFEKREDWRRRT